MDNNISKSDLIEYYNNHSALDAARYFNVSKHKIYRLLEEYDIPKHTMSQSVCLALHNNKRVTTVKLVSEEYLIDKLKFIDFYSNHTNKDAELKYNLNGGKLKKLLKEFNIKPHSSRESRNINYINTYGSIEAGIEIENIKRKEHTDYKTILEKRYKTNKDRYGGKSPFSSADVRAKRDLTVREKYNVSNVFAIPNLVADAVYKKYEVRSTALLDWVRAKLVKSLDKCKASYGTRLDSSWEVIVYEYCLLHNIEIQDRNIPIEFEYNGKVHKTFIDFKINDRLYEVKGNHLLNGCFDEALEVPITIKLDIYKKYSITIITNTEKIDKNNFKDINFIDIDYFK